MATTTWGGGAVRAALGEWVRPAVAAFGRAVLLGLAAGVAVMVPFMASVTAGVVVAGVVDFGFMPYLAFAGALLAGVPTAFWFARRGAGWSRARLERWFGVRLVAEYSPRAVLEQDARGFWWTGYSYHRGYSVARSVQFAQWAVRDRQTRREVLWLLVNPAAVLALVGLPMLLVWGGVGYLLTSAVDSRDFFGLQSQLVNVLCSAVIGLGVAGVGLLAMTWAVRIHAELACRVLGQGPRESRAQLSRRVEQLTETRADAVDAQAAELRRIERDLHDGAQARLVAIGLTLGTIEHLLESDQGAARELLAEARQASAKALQELRDLVRGIHPPVLAERGLADAVRELALSGVVPTEVTVSLPGRPEPSMETAVYFGVSELLANVAKHAGAGQVWVDVLHRAGRLRVMVTDDGHGGARMDGGGGLRGIEKRLGTFDGVLSLDSPAGGPTTITMELPCVLSSPRISTSSAKA
ncbi:histidine kinase [Kitasatospora sp. NPDC049285]|uniref:sensor histidine kinase n=1 Tax=Kitasatospora sp. NPDC049285 TaxID=3157096 RepID=UPI00343E6B58